jgi:arylsulfatase A-like enzyme
LIIVQEPFKYFGDSADPANHGTPYSYDAHVPMIIMGAAFRRGRYMQAATPTDIAPTLAGVLGVEAPSSSTGRVLIEALAGRKH